MQQEVQPLELLQAMLERVQLLVQQQVPYTEEEQALRLNTLARTYSETSRKRVSSIC